MEIILNLESKLNDFDITITRHGTGRIAATLKLYPVVLGKISMLNYPNL